jgi:predicted protein tyrosine phosphatase
MIYPSLSQDIFNETNPFKSSYEGQTPKWLFCCSAGLLRSPTAARIAQEILGYNTRSCGIHNWALVPFTLDLATWADQIVFVEQTLYQDIEHAYTRAGLWTQIQDKSTYWNIPDRYEYMHPELVEIVKQKLLRP